MSLPGWLRLIGALGCCGLANHATAAPDGAVPPESPLSLRRACELALERNDDLRVAEAQVAAALAQIRIAREFANPVLALSTAKVNTDGRTNGTELGNGLWERSYDSMVSLSQLLLVAKRGTMREAAQAGAASAQGQRDDVKRLLVKSVIQAYVGALAALDEADVLERASDQLHREAEIAGQRLKAGDISSADEARIEVAADQDRLNADSQRAQARSAMVALAALLGESTSLGTTVLSDRLPELWRRLPADLDRRPVGARPDIVAAEAVVRQADANVTLQRRGLIPDVTLSVQYERSPPDQPNSAGVGLSLPLPLWNHNTGEIHAARAARNQAAATLDSARVKAAQDVAAARIAFAEARDRARRYTDEVAPKSAAATGSVNYAYERGGASLVDLLDADRDDSTIRVAATQAQADAVNAAAGLSAALGGGSALDFIP